MNTMPRIGPEVGMGTYEAKRPVQTRFWTARRSVSLKTAQELPGCTKRLSSDTLY